jgi:hypothetical protein
VGGGVEGFHPKGWGEFGMEEKGTYDVICCAKKTLILAIPWGCMWTRETERDAMGGEKIEEGRSDKFATVVTLHALNGYMKLSLDKRKEAL